MFSDLYDIGLAVFLDFFGETRKIDGIQTDCPSASVLVHVFCKKTRHSIQSPANRRRTLLPRGITKNKPSLTTITPSGKTLSTSNLPMVSPRLAMRPFKKAIDPPIPPTMIPPHEIEGVPTGDVAASRISQGFRVTTPYGPSRSSRDFAVIVSFASGHSAPEGTAGSTELLLSEVSTHRFAGAAISKENTSPADLPTTSVRTSSSTILSERSSGI